MSADARALAASGESCQDPHIFNEFGCGFEAPTPASLFDPEPWFTFGIPGTGGFTKYTALLIASALLVMAFWYFTTRRATVVPGRGQGLAEMLVRFLRDQVTRPNMGEKGDKYLPLIVTLFLFIFVMNVMGIIPGAQLPVTSHLAITAPLAISIYLLWNVVGIRKHGAAAHFKARLVPPGVPGWILPIVAPIEAASNFVIRPVTHAVRLFAVMFAGHLLLAVFAAGGWYMFNPDTPLGGALGAVSVGYSAVALIGFIIFTFFELFIMAVQAYVFVLLSAVYLGEALEGAH